jgi:hypothetical protein
MKLCFVLFLLTFFLGTSFSYAEEVKRLENETLENFARRNGPPQAELAHTVIETEAWGHEKTVIAFYETKFQRSGETYERVVGYIFLPQAPNTYQKTLIGNFEPEGGDPKIEAVFFANADKDKAEELIVICSWPQTHYDVSGTLYGTYIFDDLRPGTNPTKLSLLKGVSKRVSGSCDCEWRDGTRKTSKYKTAASVKAGLKKLGF